MNTAHWHLLLNHVPIVGTVIGTLVLVVAYFFKQNPVLRRTALGVFTFSALVAIPAYFTGEGAEEVVEKLPGVMESITEKHEELGKIFFAVVALLGVLSIITFVVDYKRNKITTIMYVAVLCVAIAACFIAQQAGTTGGEIRHTEIRGNTVQQNTGAEQSKGEDKEKD